MATQRPSSVSSLVGSDLPNKEEQQKTQQNDEEFQQFQKLEPELAKCVKTYERWRGSYSPLQRERLEANCADYYPQVMRNSNFDLKVVEEEGNSTEKLDGRVKSFFQNTIDMKPLQFEMGTAETAAERPPKRIGVVLSGGQAPGGHNIICGIFDRAKAYHPDSRIFGFLDGPHGIFSGKFVLLTKTIIDGFRNTGGFDMLGSGRHKIESEEHFAKSLEVCDTILHLDGVVVIGGDDSNTNAALLGEYFKSKGSKCAVNGCPKTIDGDLKVMPYIPVSFGFDTACRTFSELIGNCCVDSLSAQKYYHFIRLMGRSASNIALECALQTFPNHCFIGEECKANQWGLKELTKQLTDMIESRYKNQNKNYGVVLLPEGLIEFIPEFEKLIAELNELGDSLGDHASPEDVAGKLSDGNKELFEYLPLFLKRQLTKDRDAHGNLQVAAIETEKLLAATVMSELATRLGSQEKAALVFQPQFHAFGYEGRAGLPTLFDSAYCFALGATAAQLTIAEKTGFIASVTGLDKKSPAEWSCGGVPVTSLCVIERRKGKDKPVIRKALVELLDDPNHKTLNNSPFFAWKTMRELCAVYDLYKIPGPMQFNKDSFDIPCMLRIELGGSAQLLSNLAHQVLGTTIDADLVAKDEEKYFKDILGLCKSQFSQALDEKQCKIDWPTAGEHFNYVGGSRPKSALQIDLGNKGYDVPTESFGCLDGKPGAQFLSPTIFEAVHLVEDETTQCMEPKDGPFVSKAYPNTYGRPLVRVTRPSATEGMQDNKEAGRMGAIAIVFCGRQTPGGHDMVAGLWDMINGKKGSKPAVRIVGVVGGSRGFFAEQMVELTAAKVDEMRHQGGFHLFGRSQDKFCKNREQAEQIVSILRKNNITSLVLVGGVRTATSACVLAEYLEEQNAKVLQTTPSSSTLLNVVTVPLSQGGSFTNEFIEQALGFDSTSKATARLAGNTEIDGSSARKYYYFLRTMEGGERMANACHLTLEVGLQAKPNYILLSEEISSKKLSLKDVVSDIADMVQRRWEGPGKKNFGTVIVPDNIIRVLPETRALLSELKQNNWKTEALSAYSKALLKSLPDFMINEIQTKNVDIQQIETERMLAELVREELKSRPSYDGKFSPICQFLGYQARGSLPSVFDSNYGYALGGGVAVLLRENRNGYMASAANLCSNKNRTTVFGVPLTAMLEVRAVGELPEAAIFSQLVDLHGKHYQEWKRISPKLEDEELYENPGPLQYSGDCAHLLTKNIAGSEGDGKPSYLASLAELRENATVLLEKLRPGVPSRKLRIANKSLETLRSVLEEL
ncbi:Pyrophosphate--fructose 6-phosphate 1-phosphotransferase subunit [Seminavis robusta]|uniref:Pyrophosphate--fructose 6-phosphate 1-phosphotransferase n=1 Tax=Seminavis robusta TaxID=568900 RepID=A0A9N8HH21_9STRA|nr:Pyrophosphate--fructose 6-phosphate 1-phosphotransferase subunit [Seminavis robusta]|eukprot:Sro426_g140510.1 Pyrophosphate--fructose 6-phosphate 1-phosphotransferase subunit (1299) ;mRNA; f:52515-57152